MTPHNEAEYGSIAKTVLMPGDPLRAKYIADKYLTDAKLVNKIRNMYAYTGKYKGREITIMASGIGMPSIGIYSYELYKFYDVENIIRIGSTGAYKMNINLYDVILATEAYTDSNYAKVNGYEADVIKSSEYLNEKINDTARRLNKKIIEGRVHTKDGFYIDEDVDYFVNEKKCISTEMETFALFYNAVRLKKQAASILSVSDNVITKEEISAKERETAFNNMIEIALETAINL